MSVLDDIRGLEQRVVARLRELQPLVDEYEELQRVADRLGIDVTTPPRTKRTATRRSGSASRRRPGGTRATGAERRARVLALIENRPGITVPDISKEIGVDPPPLYRVVRKLLEEGVVVKEGKSLRLA